MENSLIKDIGRSYIVSSFLPVTLFVTLGVIIYHGFLPKFLTNPVIIQEQLYLGQWLILIAFTAWLSFFLYSIVNWTIRLFEGYYLPKGLQSFLKDNFVTPRFRQKSETIRRVKEIANQQEHSPEDLQTFFTLRGSALDDFSTLEFRTPLDESQLMPTRLGNVLLASEIYTEFKYGIKSVPLWPRLSMILPEKLRYDIEEKNNQLIFLLNSTLLAYANAGIGLLLGMLRLPCQFSLRANWCAGSESPSFFERGFQVFSPMEYVLIGMGMLLAGYFIYLVSIPVAENMGSLIRASFDLYRFELLRQMNHPIPNNLLDEKNTWQRVSEYMISDNQLAFSPLNMQYDIRSDLINNLPELPAKQINKPPKNKPKEKNSNP